MLFQLFLSSIYRCEPCLQLVNLFGQLRNLVDGVLIGTVAGFADRFVFGELNIKPGYCGKLGPAHSLQINSLGLPDAPARLPPRVVPRAGLADARASLRRAMNSVAAVLESRVTADDRQ